MKKGWIVVLLLLVSCTGSYAATPVGQWWSGGNRCYQQKQYDSAAYYFEQIAAQKPENDVVYYNLGNTYYKLNNIPFAILNYERALRINPGNKEAKDNLALAQSRIANRILSSGDIFFVQWWHVVTNNMYATAWAIVTLLTFVIILGVLYARRVRKVQIPYMQQVVVVLVACWLVFLAISYCAAGSSSAMAGGVVLVNDAPLMKDDLKGKPLNLVPQGTTVEIKGEKAGWLQVRLPDGRTGWLQETSLAKI